VNHKKVKQKLKQTFSKSKRKLIDIFANRLPAITLNYAKFSHIDAGVKGTYEQVDISKDIGFNSAASSCAVYCGKEDDCDDIEYYDVEEQCMNGHIYCTKFTPMMIHHECQTDADYETPIGTIHVQSNGQINAELIKPPSGPHYRTPTIFKGEYFAAGIVVILAILAAIKCIYFKNTNEENKKQRNDLLAEGIQNENHPLISDNDQIDYSAL